MSLLWWALISFLVATVGGVQGIHERRVGCVQSGPSTLRHFSLITVVIVLLAVIGFGAAV